MKFVGRMLQNGKCHRFTANSSSRPLIDFEEWAGPLVDDDNNIIPDDTDDGESAIVFEADLSLLDKLQ